MAAMKAVVIHTPGGPEVLKIEQLPIPTPKPGQVLIQIKAFGLNRSELFTRQGHSGDFALSQESSVSKPQASSLLVPVMSSNKAK
jgi:NADPH:quinone reductase-like Zn-dependent oxidoreductase